MTYRPRDIIIIGKACELEWSDGNMISGAEIMVKCLESEGVSVIFGYPGAAICPFYDALLEGKIKPFDRVLLYRESPKLGVEYDYEEITVLDVDMSTPDQVLIKYKINTGSSEGKKYWANASEVFEGYYVFSVLNNRNRENKMILS